MSYEYTYGMLICAPCACRAKSSQKRVSDLPELELQKVVIHHVVLAIEPPSSVVETSALNYRVVSLPKRLTLT